MIAGRSVTLRPLEPADFEKTLAWINDRSLVALTGPYAPISRRDQRAWFRRVTSQGKDRIFGIHLRRGNRLIGTCGLYDIHLVLRKADLRIRIGEPDSRGRGLGTEAVRLLLDHAFCNLNLHRVALTVFADNLRAVRAYEKCGFRREGLLRQDAFIEGRYVDVLAMGILQEDFTTAPVADEGRGCGA